MSGYVGVVTLCSRGRTYLDVVVWVDYVLYGEHVGICWCGYIMFYRESISGCVRMFTLCSLGRTL